MALYQEFSGQGRVLGGHLAGGTVLSGGVGTFSKNGDLSIQHPSSLFKRNRLNAGTVTEWEELDRKPGVAGTIGNAAARAALAGAAGKALGAGLGAALNSGHTVRVAWADGKQSILSLPEKQFLVLSVLLGDLRVSPPPAETEADGPTRPTARLAALASSVRLSGRRRIENADQTSSADVAEQLARVAALHAQGVLTDAEFAQKKAELLERL